MQDELPELMGIFDIARRFMWENGNPSQWPAGTPSVDAVEKDIADGVLYVIEGDDGRTHAIFKLIDYPDPTYSYIEDGAWLDDSPYATLHRVASDGTMRGVFAQAVAFAKQLGYTHLRVDTHADNIPMQRAIAKCGFTYTGVIYIEDGSPRKAYEWIEGM
ncbi:MAG: N-acetyltransferase [Coriobacteriales bacterium]|nr:N-acetyltransferase [Coriobacteriales bacterium]MBQ6586561.1 N-acetyltransferase [Coriobacteriales bacterium]